jgi:Na+-transporting NADH:ubiquinone oxidoreductase subunit C
MSVLEALKMKGSFYTLSYAGILGAVCALLLTAAASMTAPYRKANADAERKRNILNVLQVPYPENISASEMLEIFEANIKEEKLGELELYRYKPTADSNSVESVAVSFEGPGLWGPIKGFLALDTDMKTIRGITFYEQEETPGLGGEIASVGFRDRFKGKKIVSDTGEAGIIIKGGGEKNAVNEVDAITGATMTCDKVTIILNSVIAQIVKESK